ncbi:MAG: hypothetical protein HGA85_04870, partial [Nanoarchaeota archaeon]|nr:hypothetical protein [Nanoarchaeota archaeon]
LYGLLPDSQNQAVYTGLIVLSDEIVARNINLIVEDALIALAESRDQDATGLYEEAKHEFEKLSDANKPRSYTRCCELALHLRK